MSEDLRVRITSDPLRCDDAYDFVLTESTGAVLCFVGTVRNHFEGRPVKGVEYDGYGEMAEKELRVIGETALTKWPGLRIAIFHRLGNLSVREKSVVIAVGAAHREIAFSGCRFIIEEIKKTVPIWKKEHYVDGEVEWHNEPKTP